MSLTRIEGGGVVAYIDVTLVGSVVLRSDMVTVHHKSGECLAHFPRDGEAVMALLVPEMDATSEGWGPYPTRPGVWVSRRGRTLDIPRCWILVDCVLLDEDGDDISQYDDGVTFRYVGPLPDATP